MGTLGGHVLPGSFFTMFAIWWSYVTAIRYILSKRRSPFKKNELVGYKNSVAMPCICLPCGLLKRAPLESYFKAIAGTIGLLGEVITGIHYFPKPLLDQINVNPVTNSNMMEMDHEHNHGAHIHKRDSHPNEMIPSAPIVGWHFEYVNSQHIVMYSAFIFGAIIEILLYHKYDLPKRVDYALGLIAFAVESFLFSNHLHSRDMLDIHVHTLLVFAINGCVVFCALEMYDPTQILFTYGRITFTLLQGTWFCTVGFILYPPTTDPAFQWAKNDHNQVMTVTVLFCWHFLLILIGLFIQLGVMKRIYRNSKRVANDWDELIIIDDELYGDNNRKISEPKFLTINSEDEDSIDENIEFDSTKLIKSTKDTKIKMSDLVNGNQKSPSSISSSTSGNYSNNLSLNSEIKQ